MSKFTAGRYYSQRGNPKRPRGGPLTPADVRKIVRRQAETKLHTVFQNDLVDNTVDTVVPLCSIDHGTEENDRVANEIRMKKLRIKGYGVNSAAGNRVLRVQIVKAKTGSLSSSDFNGPFNDDIQARSNYTVLYDRFLLCQDAGIAGEGQSFTADIDLRDAICKWDGNLASDFAHGQLYIVLASNTASTDKMSVSWGTSLYFHE